MLEIKTSAEILVDYASERWQGKEDRESKRNFTVISDLYAKAASYSVLNKFAFIFSIIFTVAVLMVPILIIFAKKNAFFQDYSAFQTAATGLAAISVALYNHYKKRQLYIENFMRHILYLEEINENVIKKILKEIESLDAGFSFSSQNTNPPTPENSPARKTPSKVESGSGN